MTSNYQDIDDERVLESLNIAVQYIGAKIDHSNV